MSAPSPSPFLAACAGRTPHWTPVWFMRQAGRVLPSYRRLRAAHPSVATLFDSAELAARVTLMPVEQLGVDAAILFTDLVSPLQALGVRFTYAPGPVIQDPIRHAADINQLQVPRIDRSLGHVLRTITITRAELKPEVALIGYAGSPFTLATWLVEGGSSRDFPHLRRMMYAAPEVLHALLERLAQLVADFVEAQVEAGAQAIQIFDTSVGILTPELYQQFGLEYLRSLFSRLAVHQVPRIYFPLDAAHLLPYCLDTGATVISLDWRTPLAAGYELYGPAFPLQGNLDPCLLFAPLQVIDQAAAGILETARNRPHIFNLGHGLLPETPIESIRHLVRTVHAAAEAGSRQ